MTDWITREAIQVVAIAAWTVVMLSCLIMFGYQARHERAAIREAQKAFEQDVQAIRNSLERIESRLR